MTLFCHPEAKPKGLLRGFFAIAQNDKKGGRMTEKTLRRCPKLKP
jgi:hypothetical protein